MLEYKIINKDEYDEIKELDEVRVKSYELSEQLDLFMNQIKDGKLIAIKVILDNKTIGGSYVYISPNTNSLYIDRIFILQEYRNNNYASKLLNYILSNKEFFEDYYNREVTCSMVEPSSNELIEFYKKNGYKGPNVLGNMTKELERTNRYTK